jgi:hypothetical protein
LAWLPSSVIDRDSLRLARQNDPGFQLISAVDF